MTMVGLWQIVCPDLLKLTLDRTPNNPISWRGTLKEKMGHFDLKSRVAGGSKFRPGIPSN